MGVSFDSNSGLNRLCRFHSGKAISLLPDKFSVRSRVHEYGGGAWCLAGDIACFVNNEDQAIWLKSLTTYDDPQLLTHEPKTRFADLQPDARRGRLLAISETQYAEWGEAVNRLVSVHLATGQVTTLVEGADFYSSPALSPDGGQLAWIEWDHPQQPWRCTRLMLAQLNAAGQITECTMISDKQDAAWAQPRFSPSGRLHVVVDRDNWWCIEVLTTEGFVPLAGEAPSHTEFTTAPWQLGLSTYGWNHEGELLALGQSEGYSRLWKHNGNDWEPVELGMMPARLHALASNGQYFACVAEFSDRQPAILRLDTELTADDPDQTLVLSGGDAPDFQVSLPLSLSTGVQKQQVPYFLYRPAGVPSNQALPLVIWTHGGPTATTAPILKPAIQYWTQRGFMIADVNYRGSTGYGRNYRMQLEQQWGISDVQDVEAVARSLIKQGLADPKAVFIRGNSAGGYTTLSALCHSNLFQGGASLYGVSDPARLNELTHKFESRYLHWLIADPDVHPERYQQRSPLNYAERIQVPVIFFQGEQDKVVLPEQTASMVERLRAKGLNVETHYFPDEGHGFRQPQNQAEVLEAELAFYLRLINRTLS
ncbi:prolyl oligopeptidase family serine peptidase [Nitrincola sp.]|uniref:alpha/beta hydrolase family protein n=1 Tax=Nitrincola sp. TaxID=1926584 RepID=UPI003A8FAD76